MSATLPDVYQDDKSLGSLALARRCWKDLLAADRLQLAQQFTFTFQSPSEPMALELRAFLRDTGSVSRACDIDYPGFDAWHVAGTTDLIVWSLPSLERLFMRLRNAGIRCGSSLMTLDLVIVL